MLLCCATFPLIWVGGLVTSHDAGMAVPDWPGTYGYNMFLYPWETWLFGPFDILVEHGHRLLGAAVGLITIGFVVSVFISDRRPWMRLAAMIALALVIGQGVLGGQRVLLNERLLAQIHGCIGPLFFAYSAALAVMTSRRWRETIESSTTSANASLIRFGWITVGLIFLQLVLGSFLRHATAMASRDQFRIWVVFHILVAIVVTVHLLLWFRKVSRTAQFHTDFRWPARGLVALVLVQLGLGAGTWVVNYGWPVWTHWLSFAAAYRIQAQGMLQSIIVTGHVAVGSLLLATGTALAMRQSRLLRRVAARKAANNHSTVARTLQGVLA